METAVYKTKNEGIQIQLRRYRDALTISGGMVIVLSIWDITKIFIGFFLGEDTIAKMIGTIIEQSGDAVVGTEYEKTVSVLLWVFFLLMILLFSAVVFFYHLYIGLNAYRTGRYTARKGNRLYLVLTFISALLTGFLIIENIFSVIKSEDASGNVDFAFFIMEATTLVNYIFILHAADKIRKLEKAGGEIQ